MAIPEIKCATKCLGQVSYRRLLYGIAVAVATFIAGVWLTGLTESRHVVQSVLSTENVLQLRLADNTWISNSSYDSFSSPVGASEQFELIVGQANGFREVSPCYVGYGRQPGKRALLMNPTRKGNAPLWRLIWTHVSDNSSELFSIESDSLHALRSVEATLPFGKGCL